MIRTVSIDGYTSSDCFVMDGLFDGRWIIVREWIALMGPVACHGDGLMDETLSFGFVDLDHTRRA